MFMKTTIAAAAVATAMAVAPVTSAEASPPNFYFGFNTPYGQFGFGNGPGYYPPAPAPGAMTCWQARQYLKTHFNKVKKVECNGTTYTFKVKNWPGPYKFVKINKWNGNYWFA